MTASEKENVAIVKRFFGAAVRALDADWEKPRSMAAALVGGDLDPDSREVLDLMHQDMRWENAAGVDEYLSRGEAVAAARLAK